jgi:hypothetical protein
MQRTANQRIGRHIPTQELFMQKLPLPPALAALAEGRDHILTSEFARLTGHKPQTLRKNYCLTGACFGIRPQKIGNLLLWRVSHVAALLSGDAPSQAGSDRTARYVAEDR